MEKKKLFSAEVDEEEGAEVVEVAEEGKGGEKQVEEEVCLLVGCLTSQQQASVSQGRICSDNLTCCHTEIEVADPTFYLTQSQYTLALFSAVEHV